MAAFHSSTANLIRWQYCGGDDCVFSSMIHIYRDTLTVAVVVESLHMLLLLLHINDEYLYQTVIFCCVLLYSIDP